jgi:penicillin-binding protein 2
MFVFDIFKEDGGRLKVVITAVALGMLALLGGLWFVQIVRAKQFERTSKDNAFRHVRTPAIRGRILDRNGQVLAEERPRYDAVLYLEDLQPQFGDQYSRMRTNYIRTHPEAVTAKGRINLTKSVRKQLQQEANCAVVSNLTFCVSASLGEPRLLNNKVFLRHYDEHPYMPFPIVPELAPKQVAILAEQWMGQSAVDLETMPVRVYPNLSLAANLLGYVQRRDASDGAEFSFDLTDYRGSSGVELVYDETLRGQPGDNAVLINNMNYRQREEIETEKEPGSDIYLTIDLALQRAAERALAQAEPDGRGAVVVMDPRNGDILALASAPSFDPNMFVQGRFTPEELERLRDPKYTPQFNRAMTGAYPPGSTFKIITGLACLESGLDPNEVFDSPGEYRPTRATRAIGDTAGKGKFNFERAFYRSSNTYFIVMGLERAGLPKILEVAKRFHLGERTGLSSRQEVAGNVPDPDMAGPSLGMSAPDICIGQEITASPLQMAGMISVVANGGTLYVPRVVSHSRSPETGEAEELVAQGRVRDHVQINPRHLDIIRKAMLEDTEHPPDSMGLDAGGAYAEFHIGVVPALGNFHVAGKTGTAEVKSAGSKYKKITWFDSYGPYEDPRYVVVVMVEDGASGGKACAPAAVKIYQAILKREQTGQGRSPTLAHN